MNVLDKIVHAKRAELEAAKATRPLEVLRNEARQFKLQKRPFRSLFGSADAAVLIAEIKPRSPSEGILIEKSPLDVADLYAKSEADVISVLTDEKYFGGSIELLQQVRQRVSQSILRKDFIIDEYQVYETFLSGADAFLLIAAILSKEELARLSKLGSSLGLGTLVEIHDEGDLEKALASGADVLGINNRDLKTLETDIAVTESLARRIPKETPSISESGIYTAEDVRRVRKCGVRGILVGTSILQSSDPLAKITELKQALHNQTS